jgi:hypothetical protein
MFDPSTFPLPPDGSCDAAAATSEASTIEAWRGYIGAMPDDNLDLELVKLLELIHSSL